MGKKNNHSLSIQSPQSCNSSSSESSGSELDTTTTPKKLRVATKKKVQKERQRENKSVKKRVENKISKDDFYGKSSEFKAWLKEEKNKDLGELTTTKAKSYFKKFVKKWNKKELAKKYYRGIDIYGVTGSDGPRFRWSIASAAVNMNCDDTDSEDENDNDTNYTNTPDANRNTVSDDNSDLWVTPSHTADISVSSFTTFGRATPMTPSSFRRSVPSTPLTVGKTKGPIPVAPPRIDFVIVKPQNNISLEEIPNSLKETVVDEHPDDHLKMNASNHKATTNITEESPKPILVDIEQDPTILQNLQEKSDNITRQAYEDVHMYVQPTSEDKVMEPVPTSSLQASKDENCHATKKRLSSEKSEDLHDQMELKKLKKEDEKLKFAAAAQKMQVQLEKENIKMQDLIQLSKSPRQSRRFTQPRASENVKHACRSTLV